jgi:hypothetical protein
MTNHEIFAMREKAEREKKVKVAEAWLRKLYTPIPRNTEGAELIMRAVAAITEGK